MRPCEKLLGPQAVMCADPAPHWRWYPFCADCTAHGLPHCTGHALCHGHAALSMPY